MTENSSRGHRAPAWLCLCLALRQYIPAGLWTGSLSFAGDSRLPLLLLRGFRPFPGSPRLLVTDPPTLTFHKQQLSLSRSQPQQTGLCHLHDLTCLASGHAAQLSPQPLCWALLIQCSKLMDSFSFIYFEEKGCFFPTIASWGFVFPVTLQQLPFELSRVLCV